MKSDVKIALVSAKDPFDKKSFSGSLYKIFQSLKSEFEYVIPVGPIKHKYIILGLKVIDLLNKKLFSKGVNKSHNIILSRYYAMIIDKKLKKIQPEVIFAPAAATEIAYLKTKIPIFYLSDSSFNQLKGYYAVYSNLSKYSVRESNLIEQKALQNSKVVVHSSKWASDYVVDYYKVAKNKTFVVPFGANIDAAPNVKCFELRLKTRNQCNLLFIGVDWERKGGAIAFDTLVELNNLGLDTKLTVCGCVPPSHFHHPNMNVIPFLDKNDETQYAQFLSLLNKSHFFIMPSRAECTAIALCEASAYGLPSITTNTGGTPSIIEEGVNGFMLTLNAGGMEYASLIKRIFDDVEKYNAMVYHSRAKYDRELNWESWGASIKAIILQNK